MSKRVRRLHISILCLGLGLGLGGGSLRAAHSEAGDLPPGSYNRSCADCRLENAATILSCLCGRPSQRSCLTLPCPKKSPHSQKAVHYDIVNDEGQLRCRPRPPEGAGLFLFGGLLMVSLGLVGWVAETIAENS